MIKNDDWVMPFAVFSKISFVGDQWLNKLSMFTILLIACQLFPPQASLLSSWLHFLWAVQRGMLRIQLFMSIVELYRPFISALCRNHIIKHAGTLEHNINLKGMFHSAWCLRNLELTEENTKNTLFFLAIEWWAPESFSFIFSRD